MILRRLVWWAAGAVMSSVGKSWVQQRVKRAIARRVAEAVDPYLPANIARTAVGRVRAATPSIEELSALPVLSRVPVLAERRRLAEQKLEQQRRVDLSVRRPKVTVREAGLRRRSA